MWADVSNVPIASLLARTEMSAMCPIADLAQAFSELGDVPKGDAGLIIRSPRRRSKLACLERSDRALSRFLG